MTISEFSLKILLLFLPGIISFIIIDNLSSHKQTKIIHWISYSMLLGFLSYVILYFINYAIHIFWGANYKIVFWDNLIKYNQVIAYDEIGYTILIGIFIGILMTVIINHGWIYIVLAWFHVTSRHGYPDTLSYMLGLYKAQYLTVTDWEKKIRIVGELVALSEDADRKDEIVLQKCTIYDLDSGELLYDVQVFYLAQDFNHVTIEIDNVNLNQSEENNKGDAFECQKKICRIFKRVCNIFEEIKRM